MGRTYFPVRQAVGRKMEIVPGKKRQPAKPSSVPIHPLHDDTRNMNNHFTYKDMKLQRRLYERIRPSKSHYSLARKWRNPRTIDPLPEPTCMYILHKHMPIMQTQQVLTNLNKRLDTTDAFCVFKSGAFDQHKVTVGDLVQAPRVKRKQAGDRVCFGTVLCAGSRDWTIIGKPTIPYAHVEATIEQQTLTREVPVFRHKRRHRWTRLIRHRQFVTMLRIDKIVIDPTKKLDETTPKPERLLDLWANRWLYKQELDGIERTEDGRPIVEDIYDGSEHKRGAYMQRGLTSAYRFYPDPKCPSYKK